VDILIDELGLDNLPQNKKNQLVLKMTEAILKRIFLETLEKLSDQDIEEYEKMIGEGKTPQEVDGFLRGKIQNYNQILEKVISDFKSELGKR